MDFLPIQHLKIGNYVKYIDEILHKCDKGIEYCKICPNEFVCSELEKDDFGLSGSTISDVLAAIQGSLGKVPGYLKPEAREVLRNHIKKYIEEAPVHERETWEKSIFDILLDDRLANYSYRPGGKVAETRTLLTWDKKISFSLDVECLCLRGERGLHHTAYILPDEVTVNSIHAVNRFIKSGDTDGISFPAAGHIKFCIDEGIADVLKTCILDDVGLAAAISYYSFLINVPVPEDIVITGGLDKDGIAVHVNSLDDKIEVILRELHFVDTIIIPRGSSFRIQVPEDVRVKEVSNLGQAVEAMFKYGTRIK